MLCALCGNLCVWNLAIGGKASDVGELYSHPTWSPALTTMGQEPHNLPIFPSRNDVLQVSNSRPAYQLA
jgi:hypothetical protein